jgi:hypothetical protein
MRALLIFTSCFMLSGCMMAALQTAEHARQVGKEFIFGEDVNLTDRSYGAADYLVPQMKSYVGSHEIIQAQPLVNIDAPDLSSKLAKLIPAQVGARLSQLGYHMDLSQVITEADQSFHGVAAAKAKPHHILKGTYRVKNDGFAVNLRVMELKRERIVAVFDYHLPRSLDIRKLAEPEAKIMLMPADEAL